MLIQQNQLVVNIHSGTVQGHQCWFVPHFILRDNDDYMYLCSNGNDNYMYLPFMQRCMYPSATAAARDACISSTY